MDSFKKEPNINVKDPVKEPVKKIDLKVVDGKDSGEVKGDGTQESNDLITITITYTKTGQINISAIHNEKKPLNQDIIQDIINKASKQLDYTTTVNMVTLIIQQMLNKKQIIKPGFRPNFWQRITGK